MNIKLKSIINNISYAFFANIISLVISVIMTLIVPKALGTNEYGYWQLYLFYSGYIIYINFGWCDGIYLKYGGEDYNYINKSILGTQFFMLALYEIIASSFIYLLMFLFSNDINKNYVFFMSCISSIIFVLRITLLYILQATNQIKNYARITIADRIIYCIFVLSFFFCDLNRFQILITADLIAKAVSFILAIYYCNNIIFAKRLPFKEVINETRDVIKGGLKLISANLASLLIIGIVRFAIEQEWGTEIFGKVSLTLSISNMFTTCIAAVSIALFPTLRRIDEKKLASIYSVMRTVLMIPLLGMLIAYLPLKIILSMWLPEYTASLKYMALLFPICLYETKMNILINTYLKTLRKEKHLLTTNVITVILSLLVTFITVFCLKNLDLAVLSILILLIFRCIFAEFLLTEIMKIKVKFDIYLELALTVIFIFISWTIDSYIGTIIYLFTFIIYLFIKKHNIRNTINYLKIIGKNQKKVEEVN